MEHAIIHQEGENWKRYSPPRHASISGGSFKRIGYANGLLYVTDSDQGVGIDFRVSRWKLVEIGLSCILAAISRR